MNQTTAAWIGVALLGLAVAGYLFRDPGYGEISPAGYQYATALYNVCNQRDREKLAKLSGMIDEATERQELGEDEREWLVAIIRQGEDGRWNSAADEVRQLMLDQLQES